MNLPLITPSLDWIPHPNPTANPPQDKAMQLAGRIWIEHTLPLTLAEKKQFMKAGWLTSVRAITKSWNGYHCRRCGNSTQRLLAPWPCNCGQNCRYCRACIEMGRIASCTSLYLWTGADLQWITTPDACQWNGTLSPFQQQASTTIQKAIVDRRELLVWAVCGAGKTEMLFQGLAKAFEQGMRVCLATPRVDVVRELKPRFAEAFPQVKLAALFGGTKDVDNGSQFIVATTHQLYKYARAFDAIIIDEVDAFPYHADKSLHFAANRAAKHHAARIYLTATPRWHMKWRSHWKHLPTTFVPQRYHGHPLPIPQFISCFGIPSYMKKEELPPSFYQWLQQRNKARRLIIFVPTIPMAEALAERIENAVFVHSEDEHRADKIIRFREKQFPVLIATTILERGVTFPSVDVAVLQSDHAVFDEAALVQIAGRAGRSADDPTGEVIFFHSGRTEAMEKARHSIMTMNKRAERGW